MSFYPAVTAQEMKRIEQIAVKGGCSEEAFMAEAGRKVAVDVFAFIEKMGLPKRVLLLVGKGNNGGDAFAAGICLRQKGVLVRAHAIYPEKQCSALNQKFRKQFSSKEDFLEGEEGLILDGLLGTGFQGVVEPEMGKVIAKANASGKPILAIDIPSGLDATTGEVRGVAIVADVTIALGFLKIGFFKKDGWNHIGVLHLEDFGLPKKYADQAQGVAQIPGRDLVRSFLPKIARKRHKYEAGYVVGFSGSKTFRGAPKLAGLAALRSGAGIARVFHLEEIGEAPYSLICQKWEKKVWEKEVLRASSLFLGPGLGKGLKSTFFKNLLAPMVVDADAIQGNLKYPEGTILTPHQGEVIRLVKDEKYQKWVDKTKCILVLKGAPTWIFSAKKIPMIIPHGDPGMAKAGVGDVLTGIIAALLAQKVEPLDAAILGVSLHSCAGEWAARAKTSYGVIAEDLIDFLSHAIMEHGHGVVRFKPLDKVDDSLF